MNKNNKLLILHCDNIEISTLNVKNSKITYLRRFEAQNNPDFICIQVDKIDHAITNWTEIDFWATFSEDCGY